MQNLNIALIGTKFMGRAHSNAWLNVAKFFDLGVAPVMHTVAGRNAEDTSAFADRWGWTHAATDWRSAECEPINCIMLSPQIDLSQMRICHATSILGK